VSIYFFGPRSAVEDTNSPDVFFQMPPKKRKGMRFKGVNGAEVKSSLKIGPFAKILTWKKDPQESKPLIHTIG
jgi:hypothetical protein